LNEIGAILTTMGLSLGMDIESRLKTKSGDEEQNPVPSL